MLTSIFEFFNKNSSDEPTKNNSGTLPNFLHPLEIERLEALKSSRLFNIILNFFGSHYANLTTISQISDRYFPVTPKTFPRLYDLYETACKKLEIQNEYALFCTMDYARNAKTVGTDDNCVIVIDSSCLADFSDRQIVALLGRELGHIKMKHVSYLNAFDMIDDLIQSIPFASKIFGSAVVRGFEGLFLEWLLAAEYTADRAAAIAADGIQPVMQNHLMTSGIENADQCRDYNLYTQISFSQNLNKLGRAAQIIFMSTLKTFPIPFVIPRMQELEKWSTSEECRRDFPKIFNDKPDTESDDSSKTILNTAETTSKILIKGQKADLTKNYPKLTKILIGLGWDAYQNNAGSDFDLDASVFLLNATGKVDSDDDFIFYGNLKHRSECVEHLGDNLTGIGDGDDEQIKIDLEKVPQHIEKIDFTVTIYEAVERKQNFGQVLNAFIRVVNQDTNEELLRYDLGRNFSVETAVVVGEIYRKNGEWKFNAIGSGFEGGLAALCKNYGVNVE